ncbi:hypothetical protein ACSX1A_12170 [Pontibacter sp. MBLB2868]|uniref:hypothetical protein n=1 Tax=Pontibacter sp. MBLB2868 TaxID=3451555 RepID=UPI003F74C000
MQQIFLLFFFSLLLPNQPPALFPNRDAKVSAFLETARGKVSFFSRPKVLQNGLLAASGPLSLPCLPFLSAPFLLNRDAKVSNVFSPASTAP